MKRQEYSISEHRIQVTHLRLNSDKSYKRCEERFNRACVKYGFLEDGDRILVAISGGKDSELLRYRETLNQEARYSLWHALEKGFDINKCN